MFECVERSNKLLANQENIFMVAHVTQTQLRKHRERNVLEDCSVSIGWSITKDGIKRLLPKSGVIFPQRMSSSEQ